MKSYTISVSTKHPTLKDEKGVPVVVKTSFTAERPTTYAEAGDSGWAEAEVMELFARDENTNEGNVVRAAMVSELNDGKSVEDAIAAGMKALEAYRAGEKTKRSGGNKLAKLLMKIMAEAGAGNPKAVKALQDIAANSQNVAAIAEAYAAS